MAGLINLRLLTDFFNKIGQTPTYAVQQESPLFDYLIGASEQRG
jgi:hypothetical protein